MGFACEKSKLLSELGASFSLDTEGIKCDGAAYRRSLQDGNLSSFVITPHDDDIKFGLSHWERYCLLSAALGEQWSLVLAVVSYASRLSRPDPMPRLES